MSRICPAPRLPLVPPVPTLRIPLLITVPPNTLLVPVRLTCPIPAIARVPVPDMLLEKVAEDALLKTTKELLVIFPSNVVVV